MLSVSVSYWIPIWLWLWGRIVAKRVVRQLDTLFTPAFAGPSQLGTAAGEKNLSWDVGGKPKQCIGTVLEEGGSWQVSGGAL